MSEKTEEKPIGKNGYRQTFPELATRYGVSLRTVKDWAARGKKAEDFCPLDDPGELREWWGRRFTKACPGGILALVVLDRAAKGQESSVAEEVPELELSNLELGGSGILRRLEEVELALAKKAHEPGQAAPYLSAVSRLGAEKARFVAQAEKEKKLVPKDQVKAVIVDYFLPIEQGIRGMFLTLCAATGFPNDAEAQALWLKECDKLFARFGKEVFNESFEI